jgi:hypothetical protein
MRNVSDPVLVIPFRAFNLYQFGVLTEVGDKTRYDETYLNGSRYLAEMFDRSISAAA